MMLFWFPKRTERGADQIPFIPVSPHDNEESLLARIRQLTGDEYEIYKWLRAYYSEPWIAETLLLDRRAAKKKINRVYRKLGVWSKETLIRAYGHLERPQKESVDTEKIDRYIDARAEQEIQRDLGESLEKQD